MNELINKELEMYMKIFEINKSIKSNFCENEVNIEKIEKLIEIREKLIKNVMEIEKELEIVWKNWDKYRAEIDEKLVKKIREILLKNKEVEEEIIELFKNHLEKVKNKLKNYNRGKKALSGYKIAKVNIPSFKSFKV